MVRTSQTVQQQPPTPTYNQDPLAPQNYGQNYVQPLTPELQEKAVKDSSHPINRALLFGLLGAGGLSALIDGAGYEDNGIGAGIGALIGGLGGIAQNSHVKKKTRAEQAVKAGQIDLNNQDYQTNSDAEAQKLQSAITASGLGGTPGFNNLSLNPSGHNNLGQQQDNFDSILKAVELGQNPLASYGARQIAGDSKDLGQQPQPQPIQGSMSAPGLGLPIQGQQPYPPPVDPSLSQNGMLPPILDMSGQDPATGLIQAGVSVQGAAPVAPQTNRASVFDDLRNQVPSGEVASLINAGSTQAKIPSEIYQNQGQGAQAFSAVPKNQADTAFTKEKMKTEIEQRPLDNKLKIAQTGAANRSGAQGRAPTELDTINAMIKSGQVSADDGWIMKTGKDNLRPIDVPVYIPGIRASDVLRAPSGKYYDTKKNLELQEGTHYRMLRVGKTTKEDTATIQRVP